MKSKNSKHELEINFRALLAKVSLYNPSPNEKLILSAWEFAKAAHQGQTRLSGDPTITHPLAVANILADLKLDSVSIAAGLLHDTIEDGGATKEGLLSKFGEDVTDLVDGVTKIGEIKLRGSVDDAFVENLRKMLLVMSRDLRVVFLKLADRYHNMQTLNFLPYDKQKRIARETLEVFAPLAERLEIGELKGRLEDLAFPYVYPEEYKKVESESLPQFKKAEAHIEKMKKALLKRLVEEGIKAKIDGRKKHLYSLWKKLTRPEIDWDFEEVNDIIALRILVKTIAQCYTALGVVHTTYKPVPHFGVSDFIAQPKPNGYRSIHTKVFGPQGRVVEVQIRTEEMHEEAENGLAAHWYYALQKSGKVGEETIERGFFAPSERIKWVKQLVEWQDTESDSEEFLRAVKFDALGHRIFVFSPNGDVYDLPLDSTPIDFAYEVHTDLGRFISGAKVDGKMVPLNYQLKSGQVVEIIKSKNPKNPNSDWLDFVVTTLARREINKHLRRKA